MAIKEVRSPISSTSRSAGGPGSAHSQPLSPGARSAPGRRADQAASEQPAEPTQARVSLGGEEGASLTVTGPEDRTLPRRDSTARGEPQEQRASVSDRTEEGARFEPERD
jgi:hypothetical protein